VLADVPAPQPIVARATPVVLVVADPRGFVHDSIGAAQQALVRIGRRDGRRVVLLFRASDLTASRLRGARAVVFLDTTGDPPLGPGGDPRLALVRAGLRWATRRTAFARDAGRLVSLRGTPDAQRRAADRPCAPR
jgi:hypothetical protein